VIGSSLAFKRQLPGYRQSVAVSLQLESGPDAAVRARDEVRQLLRDRVDDELLLDLQLIVSELVTNAVRYSPGPEIRVSLAPAEDGSIRGEVEDGGSGDIAIRKNADHSGGFGLRIVDAVATSWGVYEGSTHVWFEIAPRDSD
jgi:two-component sensor histidine kinase